jgi:hypothetical protein
MEAQGDFKLLSGFLWSSFEQSPILGMTSYFLPEISAASTALPYKTS